MSLFRKLYLASVLLDPKSGEGNGGNNEPPPTATSTDTQGEAFSKLLEKHKGDGNAVAAMLHGENYSLREKNRELKSKLPGDGYLVLTPDEAKSYKQFVALGDPKTVKAELETGRTASTKLADIESTATLKEHGKTAGYAPDVFARLAKQDRLELVVEDVKGKDGKTAPAVFVKGEGDTKTPIEKYAETHWGEFLPALKPNGTTTTRSSGGSPPPNGRPAPRKSGDEDRRKEHPEKPDVHDQLRADPHFGF